MHELRHHLGDMSGVLIFVRQLSILTCLRHGNAIHIESTTLELFEKFRHEHHSCNVPRGNHIHLAGRCQLPDPMVVCLLIQQGCQRQRQWIATFYVQLLGKCRRPDRLRKGQTIDLLVVVVVFVRLPVFVEVKGVDASMSGGSGNVRRARGGARRGAGRLVGRTVALRRSRWTRLSERTRLRRLRSRNARWKW